MVTRVTVIVISGERQLTNGPSISKPSGSKGLETHIGLWIVNGFLTENCSTQGDYNHFP